MAEHVHFSSVLFGFLPTPIPHPSMLKHLRRVRVNFFLLVSSVLSLSNRSTSHPPSSIIDSGMRAIAEETGTIPSHALCSLAPVKLDHFEDHLKTIPCRTGGSDVAQAHASSQTEISIAMMEDAAESDVGKDHASKMRVNGGGRGQQKTACRPQLENFKALLLTPTRYRFVKKTLLTFF